MTRGGWLLAVSLLLVAGIVLVLVLGSPLAVEERVLYSNFPRGSESRVGPNPMVAVEGLLPGTKLTYAEVYMVREDTYIPPRSPSGGTWSVGIGCTYREGNHATNRGTTSGSFSKDDVLYYTPTLIEIPTSLDLTLQPSLGFAGTSTWRCEYEFYPSSQPQGVTVRWVLSASTNKGSIRQHGMPGSAPPPPPGQPEQPPIVPGPGPDGINGTADDITSNGTVVPDTPGPELVLLAGVLMGMVLAVRVHRSVRRRP